MILFLNRENWKERNEYGRDGGRKKAGRYKERDKGQKVLREGGREGAREDKAGRERRKMNSPCS